MPFRNCVLIFSKRGYSAFNALIWFFHENEATWLSGPFGCGRLPSMNNENKWKHICMVVRSRKAQVKSLGAELNSSYQIIYSTEISLKQWNVTAWKFESGSLLLHNVQYSELEKESSKEKDWCWSDMPPCIVRYKYSPVRGALAVVRVSPLGQDGEPGVQNVLSPVGQACRLLGTQGGWEEFFYPSRWKGTGVC